MTKDEQQSYILGKIKSQCEMKNGCWEWHKRYNSGRAFLTVVIEGQRVNVTVRRFMLLHAQPDNLLDNNDTIYSTCGNPYCVNPEHLAVGLGAGTKKGHKIAGILRTYKEMIDEGDKVGIKKASQKLNISFSTLKKYLAMYEQDPQRWERLWNYI